MKNVAEETKKMCFFSKHIFFISGYIKLCLQGRK